MWPVCLLCASCVVCRYSAWLEKDHIRTSAEQAHERKDASKMHEGGKFSGQPTKFT